MRPGELVSNRFEVSARIGAGGMGVVYRARDRATGGWVALKVLHGHGGDGAERFAREAYFLSELHHPAIVGYVAHGATNEGDGYLAMQWLDGESLSERLARGPLGLGEAVGLLQRVADAVSASHARGIIHRDLKPANIFLLGGDVARPVVLDFGIARVLAAGNTLTATGSMLGTPGYMAPEQARGEKQLDARVDVYALGCVFFRCLAARAPFEADDPMSLLLKVISEPAPRIATLCPGVPPAIDHLLARMLSKSPGERPADGAALLRELAAALAAPYAAPPAPTAETAAVRSAPGAPPTLAATAVTAPGALVTQPTNAPRSSQAGLLVAGLVGGLVAAGLAVGAVFALRGEQGASATPSQTCFGEKCFPLDLPDPSQVEPLDLLPRAKALARDADSSAQLSTISLVGARDGSMNLVKSGNSASFSFITGSSHGHHGLVSVIVARGLYIVTRSPQSPMNDVLPDPKCTLKQASVGIGRDDAATVLYALQLPSTSGPPLPGVQLINGTGTSIHMLDARTCAPR